MTAPDLSTPEGRSAYRRELRAVAQPLRMTGLAIVVIAGLALVSRSFFYWGPWWLDRALYGALTIGWAILIYVIFRRSLYHRRRTAGR